VSTKPDNASVTRTPIIAPLSVRELAGLLVKHYGLHKGKYDLMLEFQIGTGGVGPNVDSFVPGVMIGMSKVGLMASERPGPTTVDAAEVNPAKLPRKKKLE
jgi:hypothetical protein